MKTFRRVLLSLLLVILVGSILDQSCLRWRSDEDTALSALLWFIALLGTLIWSAIYLQVEPLLTRITLTMAVVTLLLVGYWAFASLTWGS